MHVFYNFRLIPFYHSPTTKGHDSLEQKIFEEILKFAKEYHSFLFLQVATTDAIKSMHGSHPCLNPPWYNILIFRKSSPTCILDMLQIVLGFEPWLEKREGFSITHLSPLQQGQSTEQKLLLFCWFFFHLYYMHHTGKAL